MLSIIKLNSNIINKYIDEIYSLETKYFYDEAYTKQSIYELINEYDNIDILLNNNILIGYVIYRKLDIIHIFKILIRDNYRGKEYAKLLLDNIILTSKNFNKIYIEVRNNNQSAIKFYKKNGFYIINTINNFYKNPIDNAIIMEKCIGDK